MKNRKMKWVIPGGILLAIGLFLIVYSIYNAGRPAPIPVTEELFEGVTYHRVVRYLPRPMIAHVLVLDKKKGDFEYLVTPRDNETDAPLNARTTSQFLDEFGVQIAVNGDGFTPWWSRSPADYYPHPGDTVTPNGLSASGGDVYSLADEEDAGKKPILYISRHNDLSFNNPPRRIFSAISGDRMLVLKGEAVDDLNDARREPRTAIGVSENGRYVVLVVVDGRQPFYSDGATFTELAGLLIDFKAFFGMSLDGGGSSTMVIEGKDGEPVILNSPIDSYIPRRERPVGNHLGVFVQ
ncbi:MAG: phosphodiester glycosidase family protein [Chloroflexi bacterium]|nr:phosphodiester glycosidase family protein [Chloroflexota bacterium]